MDEKKSYRFGIKLFCRFLGLIYTIAFLSLWIQIDTLISKNGILPAIEYLARLKELSSTQELPIIPTLFWLGASDFSLHLAGFGGVLCSILLLLWVAPRLMAFGCWLFYLSFFHVSQVFLSFQWDILLLECGLLCILAAPWGRQEVYESRWLRWALWILIFKLMFSSGVVKLSSQDPVWANLSALEYHFFTQPIPGPTSWFFHQLPGWFQSFSTFLMFHIELVIPFLFLGTHLMRLVGALATIFLMILIFCSGNFAYFNLLTIILSFTCIENRFWVQSWVYSKEEVSQQGGLPLRFFRWCKDILLILVILLNFIPLMSLFSFSRPWIPGFLNEFQKEVRSFCLVNSYGLFANMTTTRPEIIIQGSQDGKTWRDYEFYYKPGDPGRRPRQVAPHQPRVDWQMWFAALRPDYRYVPWFQSFITKILEGKPEVLRIFEVNPFPERPPRFIRAVVFDYQFTNSQQKRESGNWWKRKPQKLFLPPVSVSR